MLVGERMTRPVITIRPETTMPDALDLMRKEHIRRLPVVNKNGELVGIVTEADLQKASPSEATSLSIYEITYLLSKLTVDRIMTRKVITTTEDTPLEEAARLMADNGIGGLPVLRARDVVGIITETDLFRIMLEMLGARHPGVRFSVLMPYQPGEIAKLTQAIYQQGGNIVALSTFEGDSAANFLMTVKVEGIEEKALKKLVEPLVTSLEDIGVV